MTSGMDKVAAEHQRNRIPLKYQIAFDQVTNAELASMATHEALGGEWMAYAGWELEYREAFEINVFYDEKADATIHGKGI